MEMTGFYILMGTVMLIAIGGVLSLRFTKKRRETEEQDEENEDDPS